MRLFYFLLYVTLNYTLRLFYARIKTVNSPKSYFGRTIFVSNHAASFMDPLVVGSLRRPIVFFLTRSDVFNKFTRPFLWAGHLLPIYRQQDGVDTKDENNKVFEKCTRVLSFGRNLLIFGEGFTDDVFIRRLKPVKKGAIRIGFNTLESLNWKKKIYVAAVGCNYSDPNQMRSEVLIATSDRFCLNDYKEHYQENPNKAIADVTKRVETLMQEQITHVEDINWSNFHENIMKLTRKGMNAKHSDTSIPLKKRWLYSQSLANWLNKQNDENLEALRPLKKEMEHYFSLLKKLRINENYVHEISIHHKISRSKEILTMLILFPFALLGIIHCGLPYIFVKRFTERSFKRRVFWGSVKLLLGMFAIGFFNIPVIFLFHNMIYPNYWLAILYYLLIGIYGLAAYVWSTNFTQFKEKGFVAQADVSKIISKRKELIEMIHSFVPVA